MGSCSNIVQWCRPEPDQLSIVKQDYQQKTREQDDDDVEYNILHF